MRWTCAFLSSRFLFKCLKLKISSLIIAGLMVGIAVYLLSEKHAYVCLREVKVYDLEFVTGSGIANGIHLVIIQESTIIFIFSSIWKGISKTLLELEFIVNIDI